MPGGGKKDNAKGGKPAVETTKKDAAKDKAKVENKPKGKGKK